jgi:DNA-binding IclR family transcriptional regulator
VKPEKHSERDPRTLQRLPVSLQMRKLRTLEAISHYPGVTVPELVRLFGLKGRRPAQKAVSALVEMGLVKQKPIVVMREYRIQARTFRRRHAKALYVTSRRETEKILGGFRE